MSRVRRGLAVVAAASFAAPAPAGQPAVDRAAPSVFVSYSFDDEVATGPDTFAIYRNGQGRVRLSQAFHVSGYRSVEIRDVAGDGSFPELQGYFPVQGAGRLYFHFAFLTTNAAEELNVALAGPRWFQLEKDGISFWLAAHEGSLTHTSDSIAKKLFAVEAFVWYTVDVVYDLGAGTYDLTVHREGLEEPLVALRGQPNAARQPGSAVDKFSFVGSPYGDRSNVVYYVDDVVIGSDSSVASLPFAAPGRRKLFVDLFVEYRRQLEGRPRCLPPSGPLELGLGADEIAALAREGRLDAVEQLLAGGSPRALLSGAGESRARVFGAMGDWSAGCRALESGDAAGAQVLFAKAAAAVPEGRIYRLSSVLALAGLKRFAEADELLFSLADGRDDPRYAVASAYIGLARGELDRAETWLRDPAARALDAEANPLLRLHQRGFQADVVASVRGRLGAAFRERLEETLVTEQYYYVLLWQGQYEPAREYALRMDARLRRAGVPTSFWSERAGDACFYLRDLGRARELYGRAIEGEKDFGVLRDLYLKLADIAFLTGDLSTERRFREHYYGALSE